MGEPSPANVLEHSTITLHESHSDTACAGQPCPLHNRSEHQLRSWPQSWNKDKGIIERLSPFGDSCPDPDQFKYWRSLGLDTWLSAHKCTKNPHTGEPICQAWQIEGSKAAWMYGYPGSVVTADGKIWEILPDGSPHLLSIRYIQKVPKVRVKDIKGRYRWPEIPELIVYGFRGIRPFGSRIEYLDGDFTNMALDNLVSIFH